MTAHTAPIRVLHIGTRTMQGTLSDMLDMAIGSATDPAERIAVARWISQQLEAQARHD